MGKFTAKAHRFLVWREGDAVNWETTYAALAKAVNLNVDTVRHICKSAGWKCKFEDQFQSGGSQLPSVDAFIEMPDCQTKRGLTQRHKHE